MEVLSMRYPKHGQALRGRLTPEYRAWIGMRSRCNNPKYVDYHDRGIKFCERWNDFVLFYQDLGQKPTPRHSLDRIDGNGNYEPNNCRWATPSEQRRNQIKKSYTLNFTNHSTKRFYV